jgi:hypothetical protein
MVLIIENQIIGLNYYPRKNYIITAIMYCTILTIKTKKTFKTGEM